MRKAVGITFAVVTVVWLLAIGAQAQPFRRVIIPEGAHLKLIVDQYGHARAMRPGLPVRLRVRDDVLVGDRLVIPAGTPVSGVVRRDYFPRGYRDRVVLHPVRAITGVRVPLEPVAVKYVFVLGRPLHYRTGAEVTAVVARNVVIPLRGERGPRFHRERGERSGYDYYYGRP